MKVDKRFLPLRGAAAAELWQDLIACAITDSSLTQITQITLSSSAMDIQDEKVMVSSCRSGDLSLLGQGLENGVGLIQASPQSVVAWVW